MSMIRFVSASPAAEDFSRIRRESMLQLFGSMIRSRREALGCPVEQAADLAGMESSEWAAIEEGYVPADPARLRTMAAALEISWEAMATLAFICQDGWAA